MGIFSKEIQDEVDARVNFKMQEILTGVNNRAKYAWIASFNKMNPLASAKWEALEELKEMVKKEIDMPTPYDQMAAENKRQAKDKSVYVITKMIERRLNGYLHPAELHQWTQIIVREIENAQNF